MKVTCATSATSSHDRSIPKPNKVLRTRERDLAKIKLPRNSVAEGLRVDLGLLHAFAASPPTRRRGHSQWLSSQRAEPNLLSVIASWTFPDLNYTCAGPCKRKQFSFPAGDVFFRYGWFAKNSRATRTTLSEPMSVVGFLGASFQ